jgi:uncharacterized protein
MRRMEPRPLPDAAGIKRLLGLEPLHTEGGWYAETWRSRTTLPGSTRAAGTAIYYLLEPGAFSALHQLATDEVFHFYLGDPAEMLMLEPQGAARVVRLGADLTAGERPQHVVPAGVWQGTRLAPGGRWALLGTTMAPGFEPGEFELGARTELVAHWPEHRGMIEALTRG